MTILDYVDSLTGIIDVKWGPNVDFRSNEKIPSMLVIATTDCTVGYDPLQGAITWMVEKGGMRLFANDYLCCVYAENQGKICV